jgi:hypothetical protein
MNADQARNIITSCEATDAATALESLGTSGKLTDLQSMLVFAKKPDQKIAQTAVLACSNLIRNNLIAHFHELDPQVRQKLGTIMESLVPQIIDEIGKDLWCNDDGRRLRAVQILGLLKKNPTIRDVLAKLVKLLGKIIGPNDHELIMSLLSDKDKRVRANSVEALEHLGNKRFVPILLRFRKDPANRIRGNVLKALYKLGYLDIVDDLAAMMESPDHFMKASGLWVVSQIKLSHAKIEDLAGINFLSDNEMVFSNAKKALLAIHTPRALGYMRYLESEALENKVNTPQKTTAIAQ